MLAHWRCPACRIRARVPTHARRVICACGFIQEGVVPGLGDYIAAGLHRIGITRRRYVAVKRVLGLAPLCKCPQRQRWLNEFGRKVRRGWKRLVRTALARALFIHPLP